MTDIKTVLAMSESEQKIWVASIYMPKPWKHIGARVHPQDVDEKTRRILCGQCDELIGWQYPELRKIGELCHCGNAGKNPNCPIPPPLDKSLAEIAFELRDKAVNYTNNWLPARMEVAKVAWPELFVGVPSPQHPSITDCAYMAVAKPIYWILASYIAQGETK
jgi:hypothetical protein